MSRPLLKSVFGVPVIETMRHVGFGQARVAGRTSAGRRGGRRATVGVGFSPGALRRLGQAIAGCGKGETTPSA